MKTILLFIGVIILSVTSSCQRCEVCKQHGVPIQKICRDNYPSDDAYLQALADERNAGYVCL
jgi:hypothetical protein